MIMHPSLNALRVFEVAARHLSFTKAAEELNLTQAAVSQRIKALEEYLGEPLFNRHPRHIEITNIGLAYLPPVRDALARLDSATTQLFGQKGQQILNLRAVSGLGAIWLAPRLSRFNAQYPDIDFRLSTTVNIEYENDREFFDAEIRFGNGKWSGLYAEKMMDVEAIPVCAPSLLTGKNAIKHPEDIANHTLLHVMGYEEDWQVWLEKNNVKGVDAARGIQLDSSATTLQAAQEGGGVALMHSPLIKNAVAKGRLVIPFESRLKTRMSYYFTCPHHNIRRPNIRAFKDWLFAEVEKSKD